MAGIKQSVLLPDERGALFQKLWRRSTIRRVIIECNIQILYVITTSSWPNTQKPKACGNQACFGHNTFRRARTHFHNPAAGRDMSALTHTLHHSSRCTCDAFFQLHSCHQRQPSCLVMQYLDVILLRWVFNCTLRQGTGQSTDLQCDCTRQGDVQLLQSDDGKPTR